MAPWLREIIQLMHAGRRAEAVALTRERAAHGELAAKVRLAYFGEEAGVPRLEADAIVEAAEREVTPKDSDAHWALFGAYEVGLGECEYDEKSRRATQHLHAYASATNDAQATYAAAVRYGQGTVGSTPNPTLSHSLMVQAAELGHPLAVAHVRRVRGA